MAQITLYILKSRQTFFCFSFLFSVGFCFVENFAFFLSLKIKADSKLKIQFNYVAIVSDILLESFESIIII